MNLALLKKLKPFKSGQNIIEFRVLRGALNPPQVLNKEAKAKKMKEVALLHESKILREDSLGKHFQ
jgi:hypothetical protein